MIGGHAVQNSQQMRSKMNQSQHQQQTQQVYSSSQNNAWRAIEMNQSKGGSQQNQRTKYGGSQL